MKLAIMQPYLFPYLGYFHLLREADKFISHDDVQYIKGGWINRNRILLDQQPYLYTFSLEGDSSSKQINERYFTADFPEQCDKFMRVLQTAYGNAPYFDRTKELIEHILKKMKPEKREPISVKIDRSLKELAYFMDLEVKFSRASDLPKDDSLSAQEQVMELCKVAAAGHYINLPGGKKIYDREAFHANGLTLSFLEPKLKEYPQYSETFIGGLSIVDVLMFNDKAAIRQLLNHYELN